MKEGFDYFGNGEPIVFKARPAHEVLDATVGRVVEYVRHAEPESRALQHGHKAIVVYEAGLKEGGFGY